MKLPSSLKMPVPSTFQYEYQGKTFEAAMRWRQEDDGTELMVRGNLGNLPYSAEAPVARRHLRTAINLGSGLPFADITLDSKQAIIVRGHMKFEGHPSPATVAAGTAAMTLAIKPLCNLIKNFQNNGRMARS